MPILKRVCFVGGKKFFLSSKVVENETSFSPSPKGWEVSDADFKEGLSIAGFFLTA